MKYGIYLSIYLICMIRLSADSNVAPEALVFIVIVSFCS